MNDHQKVLFKQLQLAGLGLVIGFFGLLASNQAVFWIGIGVFVLGIIRFLILKKYLQDME